MVVADEPDQRRIVRVRVERGILRREPVEQPPDLRVRDPLVQEPLHGRHLVGPVPDAGRRHHRLLIPGEQPDDPGEVDEIGRPLLQLGEGVSHGHEPIGLEVYPWPVRARSSVDRAADF